MLRAYLDAEHRNKKKKPFDFTGWEDYYPGVRSTYPFTQLTSLSYLQTATPLQENGYDCGVFTCQFMESLSRGEDAFNFTQKDMPYLRRRMAWEIGHAQLLES